jgi:hypothetical protein
MPTLMTLSFHSPAPFLPARSPYQIPHVGFANPSFEGTTHDPFARLCGSGVDHSTFYYPRQPDSHQIPDIQLRCDQQSGTALRNIQDAGPETRNLSGNRCASGSYPSAKSGVLATFGRHSCSPDSKNILIFGNNQFRIARKAPGSARSCGF